MVSHKWACYGIDSNNCFATTKYYTHWWLRIPRHCRIASARGTRTNKIAGLHETKLDTARPCDQTHMFSLFALNTLSRDLGCKCTLGTVLVISGPPVHGLVVFAELSQYCCDTGKLSHSTADHDNTV